MFRRTLLLVTTVGAVAGALIGWLTYTDVDEPW